MGKKLDKDTFVYRANEIHHFKYDYTKVKYENCETPVCIICPIHGDFYQKPELHLKGHGCPKCAKTGIKHTTDGFINKAKEVHGDKYDYSKVEYKNNRTKVCIICPEHGEFWQTPAKHLIGRGCPKCGKLKIHKSIENTYEVNILNFINKANELYEYKYNYDNINYINSKTKVNIVCPLHGEFNITPSKHLSGTECPVCTKERIQKKFALTKEQYINKANIIHNNIYDYSLITEYKNGKQYVNIICPKHGVFKTNADSHLRGHGCPKCANEINISENKLCKYLNSNINVEIETQKKFDWLCGKSLDIYIPSLKTAIEYQGRQHFMPVEKFGGEIEFEKTIKRDIEKYNQCKNNGVRLLYFTKEKNPPNNYIDFIYTKEDDLLKAILNYKEK